MACGSRERLLDAKLELSHLKATLMFVNSDLHGLPKGEVPSNLPAARHLVYWAMECSLDPTNEQKSSSKDGVSIAIKKCDGREDAYLYVARGERELALPSSVDDLQATFDTVGALTGMQELPPEDILAAQQCLGGIHKAAAILKRSIDTELYELQPA